MTLSETHFIISLDGAASQWAESLGLQVNCVWLLPLHFAVMRAVDLSGICMS